MITQNYIYTKQAYHLCDMKYKTTNTSTKKHVQSSKDTNSYTNEETFSNTENPLSDGQIQIDTQNKHIHCMTTQNKLKNIDANRYLNDNTNSNMLNTSRTYDISTAPFKPENRTPMQSL